MKHPNITVKLTGTDSNAFFILANCQKAAKKGGLSAQEINEFTEEAQNGDYTHLLATCQEWFNIE